MADAATKPHVIVCSHPALGHFLPMRLIAKDLKARGHRITFVSGPSFRSRIEQLGITFVPLTGAAAMEDPDLRDKLLNKKVTAQQSLERINFAFEQAFSSAIPVEHEILQELLTAHEKESAAVPVVVVHDMAFAGTLPVMLGAPGQRPAGFVSIGVCPMFLSSEDCAPFGVGRPPDSSETGKIRNKVLNRMAHLLHNAPHATVNKMLESLGAHPCPRFFLDTVVAQPDRFLQMCIPELEYPRSDAPPNIRFTGGLPKGGGGEAWTDKPAWWAEMLAAKEAGAKIVGISQGTLLIDYEDLIVPALASLANEENVRTVAALGKAGAQLPSDFTVPSNAFVGDYIPFGELMPLCDVFVTNGGYGGFQAAISVGVPVIIAGVGADKPEVAARAVWAGVGLDLKTDCPTEKEVKAAVLQVLSEDHFKKRAMELSEEIARWNCFDVVAQNVQELAENPSKPYEPPPAPPAAAPAAPPAAGAGTGAGAVDATAQKIEQLALAQDPPAAAPTTAAAPSADAAPVVLPGDKDKASTGLIGVIGVGTGADAEAQAGAGTAEADESTTASSAATLTANA